MTPNHYIIADSDGNIIADLKVFFTPDDVIEAAHSIINTVWVDYEEGTILAVYKHGDTLSFELPFFKFSRVGPRRTRGRHPMKLAVADCPWIFTVIDP